MLFPYEHIGSIIQGYTYVLRAAFKVPDSYNLQHLLNSFLFAFLCKNQDKSIQTVTHMKENLEIIVHFKI